MFKFLSDLGVLVKNNSHTPVSFNDVIQTGKDGCLKYYFSNVRNYIKELFPPSTDDGTTLINGMTLNPNVKEDNQVFFTILTKFKKFGDLRNIDPEFKSRIFEDFLKQSTSKKNWGQFFTPRNVVKAVIEMSDIEKLQDNSNVCDPASGVGGFVLEPIATKRPNDYYFDSGELKCKLNYFGFERGIELDDKLTIVLAKANFVIYLSEVLRDNPTMTEKFAEMFNHIFKIYTNTILGSLSEVRQNYYDLIMSNPPYVMSGSGNYKKAIKDEALLNGIYTVKAMGLEGLFVEKIITELKTGGKALIIIPDGILNRLQDKKLRKYIKKECIINAIVSLPLNTFYATPKKTYIISLTKKFDNLIEQIEPVFTYLVSNIGETLNVDRFPTKENDLKDMVKQYRYFMTGKDDFVSPSDRCKIQPISIFDSESDWSVDKWWTKDEKIILGIEEEDVVLTVDEFYSKISDIQIRLQMIMQSYTGENNDDND